MINRFAYFVIILLVSQVVLACQPFTPSPTSEPVTITFYRRGYVEGGSDITSTTIAQAAQAFEQAHPNINVEVVGLAWTAEGTDQLEATLKDGGDIHVFSLNSRDLGRYVHSDYLSEITPYLNQTDQSDFYTSALEAVSFEGKPYAWPLWATTVALYANPALLKERGVEPPTLEKPWTWDEFVAAAEQLTFQKADGAQVYGFSASSKPGVAIYSPLMYIDGGRVLSPDGKRFVQNSPEAISALQKISDLVHVHKVTPPDFGNVDQAGAREQFKDGSLAMIMDTPNLIAEFEQENIPFIVLPPPTGKANTIVSIGAFGMYGVYNTPDQARRDAAHEFARYLTGSQVARDVPGYQQAPSLRKSNTAYATNEARSMIARLVSFTIYDPSVPISPDVYNQYQVTLQAILLGLKTPQQAMDEIASLYQKELDSANQQP
jgi:multiple sugar transport system substrate-binding protein